MALFNINEIEKHLLPIDDIALFSDIKDKSVSNEVLTRLNECACQWDNYTHLDYGDSYGEYKRNKNRCNFENLYINRRHALIDFVFYEIFIGGGRYINNIEELIMMICAEDTWCVPAHAATKPSGYTGHVIELYASESASVLALACYFLKSKLPKKLIDEVRSKINERIFIPYTVTDEYKWMGVNGNRVNNWNPWINSNVMLCAALILTDEEKYKTLVLRACALTENYIRSLPDDFMCDEGVRYWNLSAACLFDLCELLYDLTGGKVDLTRCEPVVSSCSYPLSMYDDHGLPANFADATIEFYPDCALLARAGTRTGNPKLAELGEYLYKTDTLRSIHDNFYRQLKNIYTASNITKRDTLELPQKSVLRGINIVTMRKNGFFVCFKGNHNGESHNHNDAGSFVIYRNGTPLFIDPGVDHYSGYTFDSARFKLWYLRSDYHNLPIIDGCIQKPGREFSATPMQTKGMSAHTEISGAYGLTDGEWIRSINFESDEIKIKDRFTFKKESAILHYILKEAPTVTENRLIFSDGTTACFDGITSISIETIDITGKNPPDGIIGDAANRKTDIPSVLIPRIFERQWKQSSLYRVTVIPCENEVTLTVKGI